MPSKTLDQWLAFIEANHSQEIDLGLERVNTVAEALSLLDLAVPVITVAGTNGKGSTVAYMDSVLGKAGYRVGCYTSPHFLHYNERVLICGQPVADQPLCDAFSRIYHCAEQLEVSLTYFEYGTLAALLIFQDMVSQQQLDVVLLEVGLGGRLDAANIVEPQVAVVTTVALDHQSWLGLDRDQIGFEKAGIYRADKPALYGEVDMPDSVQEQIDRLGATRLQLGEEYLTLAQDGSWSWQGRGSQGQALLIDDIPYPALPFDNAATAIQALSLLNIPLSAQHIRQGIAEARLTGRCQQLSFQGQQLLLDVAHNPHAAEHLAEYLQQADYPAVRCVVGMLGDKDVANTLMPLASKVGHWYVGTLDQPRGLTATELCERLPQLAMQAYDSVSQAFLQALEDADEKDLILIMGSFFTVAEVLNLCQEQQIEHSA